MRFLIRDILIATFFVAIGTLYFSSERNLTLLSTRLATQEKQNEGEFLENAKLIKQRDFVQADIDRCIQLEGLIKQLESHFPTLQAKYASVEPRDSSTVSVRQIPQCINRQTGADVSRIRVHVPSERSVFLKYGIAMKMPQATKQRRTSRLGDNNSPITEQVDLENIPLRELHLIFFEDGFATRKTSEMIATEGERGSDWQSISDYSDSGPFEYHLPKGIVDIDLSNNVNHRGLWEVQLNVNEKSLLTAVLQYKTPYHSYSTLLATSQLDFAASKLLPMLFSSRPLTKTVQQNRFEIQVWLDEQSSGFSKFPETSELQQ